LPRRDFTGRASPVKLEPARGEPQSGITAICFQAERTHSVSTGSTDGTSGGALDYEPEARAMTAESPPIDAPAEAALTPFRCWAAGVAGAQENALAVGQAGAELMSSLRALWWRQALTGARWALAAVPEDHVQEDAMRVSECMTREVQLADPNDTIADAAKAMARLDAGVLPVQENDRLIGMITDRDIAVRGVAMGKGPDAKVADVMNAEVKYCFDDQEVGEVLRNMGELQLRRMPVLNHDKRLVGIISLGDLAMAANGQAHEAGDALSDICRPGGQHSQTAH
jgi:CBS domain-containing protein